MCNVSRVLLDVLIDAMQVTSAEELTLEVKGLTYDRKMSKKLLRSHCSVAHS